MTGVFIVLAVCNIRCSLISTLLPVGKSLMATANSRFCVRRIDSISALSWSDDCWVELAAWNVQRSSKGGFSHKVIAQAGLNYKFTFIVSPPDILFEDNHLLAINKPCGVLVQGDITGDKPLVEMAKEYVGERYKKPGAVFLGVV